MNEKIVTLSEGNMPYFQIGNGPSMVFLHGGIATPGAYTALLKLLSSEYTVTAPTLPGHGNSFAIGPDWNVEDYIRVLDEFFRSINCVPEIITGHSLGGMLALYLASLNYGKRVLVLDPIGLPIPLRTSYYIKALFAEAKAAIRARPDLEYMKKTLPTAGTLVHTLVRHPGDIPWFYTKAPAIDISTQLSAIHIPTYLFWGEIDQIVPLSIGKTMHKIIKTSTLITFPNFGHAYPVTAPEMTFERIKSILI